MSIRLRMVITVATALASATTAAGVVLQGDARVQTGLIDEEKRAGWSLLFDGKTLNGWRGYNKPDAASTRWKVEDGLLTVDPGDGRDTRGALDLITNETFDDFELSVDWRISAGGNSGIKYFVLEDRDAAIGHEYQIIDDERHPDAKLGPKRQTSALYDVLAAANRPMRPAGTFNSTRVLVRGDAVEHWLNGTQVLRYQLASPELQAAIDASKFKGIERFGKPQKGHILLQDHGDRVWYRNVKIRRISSEAAPQATRLRLARLHSLITPR